MCLFAEERPGDVKHSLADIGKARALIGYSVDTSVEAGLRNTTDSLGEN